MEKEELRFKISQLRNDKIIYAVESCATNLICLFSFFFSNQYLSDYVRNTVNIFLIVIAVGYTVYMGIGNACRLREVKELEVRLESIK
ncbi:MAG: hypothetical protein V1905_02925 [bacterium]